MRKAFICPTKYVQGENELLNLGYFVSTFGKTALLIAHKDDVARVKEQLQQTAEQYGISFVESGFSGECSRKEVARLQQVAKDNNCDCTIGLGGGKAIDTSKCVAEGEALIIVPTIAATDAPTSHSAVLYTEDGSFDDYAYFKQLLYQRHLPVFLYPVWGMHYPLILKHVLPVQHMPMLMQDYHVVFVRKNVVRQNQQRQL